MTVSELLRVLKAAPPHHVVQVWDTWDQRFEGRLGLSVNHTSDELQINLGSANSVHPGNQQLSLDWTMRDSPPGPEL